MHVFAYKFPTEQLVQLVGTDSHVLHEISQVEHVPRYLIIGGGQTVIQAFWYRTNPPVDGQDRQLDVVFSQVTQLLVQGSQVFEKELGIVVLFVGQLVLQLLL